MTDPEYIECAHCSEPVAENANQCPHCGGNLSGAIGAFAAVFAAGLCLLFGLAFPPLLLGVPLALIYAIWVWRRFGA
jgi:hypothetical protein